MVSDRVATGLLVGVVLLAGCGAFPVGSDDAGADRTVNPRLENTPSVTPTAVPDYPPGVTADAVRPETVGDVHETRLRGSAYTHRTTQRVTRNGTVLGNATLLVQVNGSTQMVAYDVGGRDPAAVGLSPTATTVWTNATETVERSVLPNGTVMYDQYEGSPFGFFFDPTAGDQVRSALRGTDPQVAGQASRDGRRVYVIRGGADRLNRTGGPDARNLTLRLVITEQGYVLSYDLRYETVRTNRTVTVQVRFELLDLGNTTIARPDWYDAARNASRTETPLVSRRTGG